MADFDQVAEKINLRISAASKRGQMIAGLSTLAYLVINRIDNLFSGLSIAVNAKALQRRAAEVPRPRFGMVARGQPSGRKQNITVEINPINYPDRIMLVRTCCAVF